MKPLNNRMIYGEMPQRIPSIVASTLEKKEVQPVKRKSFAAIVIAAVLILAIACTALAVSLNLSAQYTAIQQARTVVMEKYGFTQETLGLFYEETDAAKGGGWTIYFRPIKYADQLGTYTVELPESGTPTVRWSYDGIETEAVASGRLDSTIWGHKQIQQVLSMDEAYMTKLRTLIEEKGYTDFWTLEERAELDQMLVDTGYWPADRYINVLPSEEDLTAEEATALAKEAVAQKYGVSGEALDERRLFMSFMKSAQTEQPFYIIYWTYDTELTYMMEPNDFNVMVYSPSGDIGHCIRSAMPETFRLPEGSLAEYEEAVREFIEWGAFETLTNEEKADVARRMREAGFGELLNGVIYTDPSTSDVTEADAIEAAQTALEEAYGLTEAMWSLFEVQTSHVREAGKPVWHVDLGHDWRVFYRPYPYEEKIGTYRAIIDAQTGEALDTIWSLQDVPVTGVYTENTWGQAIAWNADLLAYALTLDEKLAAFMAENETDGEWTLETAAAYNQMVRDAGFDREMYSSGLPAEGELQQEAAEAILFEAIRNEYGLSEEALAGYRVAASFSVADPERPVWNISLYSTSMGKEDFYNATIAAQGGEILVLEYVAQGNG